jgi:hypothetical protein
LNFTPEGTQRYAATPLSTQAEPPERSQVSAYKKEDENVKICTSSDKDAKDVAARLIYLTPYIDFTAFDS